MLVLELAAAVVGLFTVAGSGAVGLRLRRTAVDLADIGADNRRLVAVNAENERMAKSAREVAEAVETTSAAVDLGTTIVQSSHKVIASIPFEILDAIPATRDTSRIVRGIHDGTADAVYRSIFGVNKAIRDALNRPPDGVD